MRTPVLSPILILLAAMANAGEARTIEVSREFSSSERKDPEAMLAIAVRDRVPWNRRTALAWYFAGESDAEAQRLVKTVIACAGQEGGLTDIAVTLAVSERAGTILPLLAKAPATRRIAAETLATRAVMTHCARAQNAAAAAVRTRPAEGLPNPRLAQAKALPGSGDQALVQALLASRDRIVAERALIAAAYGGGHELIAPANAAVAKGEVADACRLLLRARHGQPIDAGLAAAVAAAKVRPQIAEPHPALSLGGIDVPAQCILLDAIIAAGDAAQVDLVGRLLGHGDIRIRIDACRAARRLAAPELARPLASLLPDAPWPVLVEACSALGEIASPEAVEALISALRKRTGSMREDIVHALGMISFHAGAGNAQGMWRMAVEHAGRFQGF